MLPGWQQVLVAWAGVSTFVVAKRPPPVDVNVGASARNRAVFAPRYNLQEKERQQTARLRSTCGVGGASQLEEGHAQLQPRPAMRCWPPHARPFQSVVQIEDAWARAQESPTDAFFELNNSRS
eukprot:5158216-Pleurochrysis_carterae.AAC.2